MIVAVLDTNVLASGIAGISRPESTPGALLRRWRAREFALVMSEPILAELIRTLTNPYFASRLEAGEVTSIIERLRNEAQHSPITTIISGIATHPEDDLILATALSSGAAFLVTGDRKLQALGHLEHVAIVSPRDFLDHVLSDR